VKGGLLAALSQEDIDRVSSIYFTQELLEQELLEDTESQKDQMVEELSYREDKRPLKQPAKALTKISRTSIQVTNFTQQINEQ
jgi:hypothetical protein